MVSGNYSWQFGAQDWCPATHAGHADDHCLVAFLSDLPSVILPVTFSGDHTLSDWSLLSPLPGSPFPSVAAFQASPWSQHPRSLPRCFCSSRKSEGRWCGQGGEVALSFHPSWFGATYLQWPSPPPQLPLGSEISSTGPLALKEAISPCWDNIPMGSLYQGLSSNVLIQISSSEPPVMNLASAGLWATDSLNNNLPVCPGFVVQLPIERWG